VYDEVCAPRHPEKKMNKLFRRSAQALFCQIFANIPGKEFDASLGTAAAYQRNLEVYVYFRGFLDKEFQSKEISQQRNLAAKKSHSKGVTQQRSLTAKKPHSR